MIQYDHPGWAIWTPSFDPISGVPNFRRGILKLGTQPASTKAAMPHFNTDFPRRNSGRVDSFSFEPAATPNHPVIVCARFPQFNRSGPTPEAATPIRTGLAKILFVRETQSLPVNTAHVYVLVLMQNHLIAFTVKLVIKNVNYIHSFYPRVIDHGFRYKITQTENRGNLT